MSSKRNIGSLVGGSLLIFFGILALVGKVFQTFNFWEILWPFFIIGIGALFFVGMFAGGRSVSGLAIPGSIITTSALRGAIKEKDATRNELFTLIAGGRT